MGGIVCGSANQGGTAPAGGCERAHPLAGLYAALGHRVVSSLGATWIDVGRFSMTPVPYAGPVEATREDCEALLRQAGRWVAVFPTTIPTGITSGAYWVRDRDYGLSSLQKQFRQHVRRGMQSCAVRPLDWETLRKLGLGCNLETMQRRGVEGSLVTTQAGWDRVCEVAADVEGLEAFGCFHGDQLLAFLISWTHANVCEGLLLHRMRAGDQRRASHLLYYEFTRMMCQREALTGVTMGRHWLPPHRSIDQFKRHAGYQVEPIQVAAVLRPSLRGVLASPITRSALRQMRRWAGTRLAVLDNVLILDVAVATQLPHPPMAGR